MQVLPDNNVQFYLEDALSRLLLARDTDSRVNTRHFLTNYFKHVKNGTHTMLRDNAFIKSTVHNRISFLSNVWECYRSMSARLITKHEFCLLIQLICPDFPSSILNLTYQTAQSRDFDCSKIPFVNLFRVFQFHILFEGSTATQTEFSEYSLERTNAEAVVSTANFKRFIPEMYAHQSFM
ncbi:hypothetical protein AHF37_10357 [Paragonimus kellicotti]|nr:hypothetical protein AHF37_10357 [Paragonimus kellicotti]